MLFYPKSIACIVWASEIQNPLALTGNSLAVGKRTNVNIQPCNTIITHTQPPKVEGRVLKLS